MAVKGARGSVGGQVIPGIPVKARPKPKLPKQKQMPIRKTVTKIVNGKVLQIQVKPMPRRQTATASTSSAAAVAGSASTAAKATQAEAAQGSTTKAETDAVETKVGLMPGVCGKDMESEDDEGFFSGEEGEVSPLPDWD